MTRKREKSLVARDTEKFLKDQGLPPIHILLASIAAGYDPRKGPTDLQNMIKKLGWHMPTSEQWQEIRAEIMENPLFGHEQVSLGDSLTAMKEVLKYAQPQLKSVEMGMEVEVTKVSQYTQEDRDAFAEFFQETFGADVFA